MMKRGLQTPDELRREAEERLEPGLEPVLKSGKSCEDAESLNHELRVHQVELEMQNEELRRAHDELEISRTRYSDLYDFAPVGYLTLNRHGQIIELNLSAAKQLGAERTNLINKNFQNFVFSPDKKEFLSRLKGLFDTHERQIVEVRVSPKVGDQFHARLESIYVPGIDDAELCRTSTARQK